MSYTAKTWATDDPITVNDLNHIETGLARVSNNFNSYELDITADKTATVTAAIGTYAQPGTVQTLMAHTAPAGVDQRVLVTGFVTLKHSQVSATPDLSAALVDENGAVVRKMGIGNRSRESSGAPVIIPFAHHFTLAGGASKTLRLAVSSSVAGTVTIVGGNSFLAASITPIP